MDLDALPPHLWLLEALGRATPKAAADPPRIRRVFVNRTVRMDQIEVIGFDMDYTLALYHQAKMEELSAACTLQKLVANRGYSEAILALPYDARFGIRGLVVDKKYGNLLKMDRYGFVGRGYHGTRPLGRPERLRLYREEPVRLSSSRYAWIDTLFALPEAVLYAQLVDFLDADPVFQSSPVEDRAASYTKLWTDIRECIDEAHRDDSIKGVISAALPEYVKKDPELAATLHRFRSAGKRLFILTNSNLGYTNTVMSYLLDGELPGYPTWRSYFDAVVVSAHKPAFFVEERPLTLLEGPAQAAPGQAGMSLYEGGNVRALSEALALPGDRVLYIGDHIYGDMLRAKRSSVWRTAMIVQELEQELERHAQVEGPLQRLEALDRRRHRIDAELRYQHLLQHQLESMRTGQHVDAQGSPPPDIAELYERLLQHASSDGVFTIFDAAGKELSHRIEELRTALKNTVADINRLELDIEHTFNPFWGPLLKEGTENSRLGQQVEDFACLYTSRVSNFLAYSPFQYFRSPRDHLPHERVY
jgi:HAD superfamily 5'-nucleotidase-like hydrolase